MVINNNKIKGTLSLNVSPNYYVSFIYKIITLQ